MIEQSQTELEKAEIASIGALDDFGPPRVHGVRPEIDDREAGKASGDHQLQARAVSD
jgi:hypothetical protein